MHLNKAIAGSATPVEILPNHNKCIIHFLDMNTNLTVNYLKSAWNAGSLGQNNIYLANIKDDIQLARLDFSEVSDLKRIFVIKSSKVTHDIGK